MAASSSSNPWISLNPDGKSQSFKEVLMGGISLSYSKLDLVQSSFKGLPALMFDDKVISQLSILFAFTLVGKFVLGRLNLDIIQKFFLPETNWNFLCWLVGQTTHCDTTLK